MTLQARNIRKGTMVAGYLSQKRFQHANNTRMLDVEITKGIGTKVWDRGGKEYLDLIAGTGSLIFGHCHPKLIQAAQEQMCAIHMTSRSLSNSVLPEFSQTLCQTFNYDKVLVMNTGTEACELSLKMARIWGYRVKKLCRNKATILVPADTLWGHTIAAASSCTDAQIFSGIQPMLAGLKIIPYNDVCTLEEALKNPNVCGFFMEPVQFDLGVQLASDGYMTEVRRLCTQNKVLWIANECQTGLGRTGKLLGVDHECVKPDILVLGSNLGAGLVPVSAVLSNSEVMDQVLPGTHSSTYAGNPLGARIGLQTLRLLKEEGVVENAETMGTLLRDGLLCSLTDDEMPTLKAKGLMIALKIDPRIGTPCEVAAEMKDCGLLIQPCKDSYLRLLPPLSICEEEVTQTINIIKKVIEFMKK